ncbi:MAG: polysaccharide pyruvyl transferase family protein [Prevotellaceae bacterium]|nr:polysaccharide pyruvyl transferase family protein [Prevotellaceae bacterium]
MQKMKTYSITCHDCYNYGASLQAYALQAFLQKEGYEHTIIDYKPEYLSRKYRFTTLRPDEKGYSIYRHLGPLKSLLALCVHRKQLKNYSRKCSFDRFTKRYLCLTQDFHNCNEIEKANLDADVFIAGSDQIWNTDMQNGRDGSFYMAFERDKSKKISYAASFGISTISEEYSDFVREQIGNIRWVSVRETTGVQLANSLGVNAVQVMDPVFLLADYEWKEIIPQKEEPKDKYLLLYYLGKDNDLVKELALKIARKKGLKIYALNDGRRVSFADKNINDAGPLEFLYYLSNASFVFSTSFHATAFSLIFKRQFFVCPLVGQRNSSRMADMLQLLGIGNRCLDSLDYPSCDIDYPSISALLEMNIAESKRIFLENLSK